MTFLTWTAPLLLAAVLHEMAHALAARAFGDTTSTARITLNPLAHFEPIGTIVLSALLSLSVGSPALFPWLRPVRFDASRLRGAQLAMFAAAGPAANALMLALWFVAPECELRTAGVTVNATFLFVNLLPIPPLDGWRIIEGLKREA